MRKKLAVCMLLAGLVGWGNPAVQAGKFMSQASNQSDRPQGGTYSVTEAPGLVGPWGQPVEARAPAVIREPTGADYARAAIMKTYPNEVLTQGGLSNDTGAIPASYLTRPGDGNGIQQVQAMGMPGPGMGMPGPGMGMPGPGMGMPGPGGMCGPAGCMPGPGMGMPPGNMPQGRPGISQPGVPGAVAAVGALTGQPAPYSNARTEIRFVGPAGMKIAWYAPRTDGKAGFSTQFLEAPARYNFLQSSIYRLKLSDIPNRPGVDLYPTLEVPPANYKTSTFLAHSSVPLSFTEEDFEQVAAGNFVVKVIYLPDPQFQDLASTGPDEVVSSRLEAGADPILEAKRRGSVLAIVRLGNIDLEAPNTPAMDSPDTNMVRAYQQQMAAQQQQMAAQQMAMIRANMMRGGPGGQPNMAGMMPPGMGQPTGPGGMTPGMYPPGMLNPGGAPIVPVNPGASTPSAPTVPTPLVPRSEPATSPVGQAPSNGTFGLARFLGSSNGK
jgi:hypothetical protein